MPEPSPGARPPAREPPIYLDYAATTPVDPRVVERMLRHLGPGSGFGNPASRGHRFGARARDAVERARAEVAALVGASPPEIVWTSGATESDNLALLGAARRHAERGRHLVTAATEHPAVLDACRALEREGFAVTRLLPAPDGGIDPAALEAALRPDTILVSIMHVNNETGVAQDLEALGQVTRARGILFHVDAAQSAGRLPIDLSRLPVDLLSLSAHKVYGPKGVGALYVRRRPPARIDPILHGGGHERGLRPGTLPTHQIAGMGEAFRIAAGCLDEEAARVRGLRERLWAGLARIPGARLNGRLERSAPGILNVSFAGVPAEDLMAAVDGIALSSGSACASARGEPSHVLRALGLDDETIDGAVRLSFGRFTTVAEIERTIERMAAAVARLRAAGAAPPHAPPLPEKAR